MLAPRSPVGLDRLALLPALVERLRSSRVGLVAHPASVNARLRHAVEVLRGLGIEPRVLFGPEHGYGGEAQDMVGVESARDPHSGAPIVSLYGDSLADLSPKPEHLAELDVLVIDLQDVGSRYYTFVWTALLAVRAAAKVGVHSIVLDRPNPLGSRLADVAGRVQRPGYLSFVGLEPVPIRHGLTLGEVVAFVAEREGLVLGSAGALSVVRTPEGGDSLSDLAAPFVPPSPNMPSLLTALVYPGGCLLEGTNLSEGRGHTRPFEIVGAPFVDGRALAEGLLRAELPGVIARPLTFQPTFHKHAGRVCGGVQLHPTDLAAFRPVATYAALVGLCREQAPEHFRFRTERYEYVDHLPALDLLAGGPEVRERLERGEPPAEVAWWLDEAPGWSPSAHAARDAVRRAEA